MPFPHILRGKACAMVLKLSTMLLAVTLLSMDSCAGRCQI